MERKDLIRFSRLILVFVVVTLAGTSARAGIDSAYNERLGELLARLTSQGWPEEDLLKILGDPRVTLYPQILEKRAKGLNYRGREFGLLTTKSVLEGKAVLKANRHLLQKIETVYGVGPEFLVAILRVETNFGRVKGNYPVFNSLLTMTLLENRRSAWAAGELEHLLLLSLEQERDPLSVKGSWAGAFGLPQFIPSSFRKYGADGNRDGMVDLDNLADAFASIASYLKSFGWSRQDAVRKHSAVYAYNHCDNYVRAVLAYARALEQTSSKGRIRPQPGRRSPKSPKA
jgi:membrane-bound lytic murein transglycosylase B